MNDNSSKLVDVQTAAGNARENTDKEAVKAAKDRIAESPLPDLENDLVGQGDIGVDRRSLNLQYAVDWKLFDKFRNEKGINIVLTHVDYKVSDVEGKTFEQAAEQIADDIKKSVMDYWGGKVIDESTKCAFTRTYLVRRGDGMFRVLSWMAFKPFDKEQGEKQ